MERKRETGKRLQEVAVKTRLEKVVRQEEELVVFTELKASGRTGRKVDYDVRALLPLLARCQ
jgi:actin-related protein 5